MKLHTIYLAAAVLFACALTGCKKENPDSHDFTNKVFVEAASKPIVTLLKKGAATEMTKILRAALADPAEQHIALTFAVAPEMVATYNAAFYDQAVALPEAHYSLLSSDAEILPGSVVSSEVAVNFQRLDELDRDQVYVLPVTLVSATNIEMLERSRTTYYVFRGSALIDVVGNLLENHLDVKWTNPSVVYRMSKVTIEALIRVKKFDRAISTVLGIENHFLLRIGDAGIGSNQIQLATSDGNLPSQKNADLEIPEGEWVHLAVTYDYNQGGMAQIYINGVLKIEGVVHKSLVTLGVTKPMKDESENSRGFHIGVAYELDRTLNGDLSEVRIWNRVLSAEEINEKDHFYYADPKSPGLVCYWKFDDGEGNTAKDYTGNGNHASAVLGTGFTWNPVQLPTPGK